jgi:putative flippase GtrA
MNRLLARLRALPLVGPVLGHRFVKFGTVGFSGTLVNLSLLYLGQEYLYATVTDADRRLDLSLATAIVLATLNNFTWNRLWTWRDRRERLAKPVPTQLVQYFVASWLASALQFAITKGLALYLHYLAANLTAIVLAAALNYLVNDAWTFGLRRRDRG